MSEEKTNQNGQPLPEDDPIHNIIPVTGLYENWFLDYASYVILERAVPTIQDGLKPVQRRILHAMKVMDDGRYNKVANIIGSTMQYHPHGDVSIGDAIVHLAQKELLIDTQGNWGDIRTGDSAAAPRYIEARLSKFALEVLYNPQTTEWQLSYDGRKKEPVTLPAKFPLLLAQGAEGIAVGLSTKILPHNFLELCKASVNILKGKKPEIYPDFPTGGMADFSDYNEGRRGSRVRIRAKIEEQDSKTLVVNDMPFGTTTVGLIDSILKAVEKGKIKVKQVIDNTAQEVEIIIKIASGQSPDIVTDALYAFTDCEVSVSPNACVIVDEKPQFMSVTDILKINTQQTIDLHTKELEIRKGELLEQLLFSSLEKIFIQEKIYRDIEECETWESVIDTIDTGLEPFKKQFYREITREDIVKLTEIKIKRISKYDSLKADEQIKDLEKELKETEYNLGHVTEYTIDYFNHLVETYGAGKERRTEIKSFDTITAKVVAATNQKLYVNRQEGFIGWGLKKDEYISECSDLDDILVIRKDGVCRVSRIQEKVFMGKDIMYAGVFKKNDDRMVYNMVYVDGKTGRAMVKRFNVLGVTLDKEYDLTKGHKGSKVLWITANPNGEAEVITVKLTAGCRAHKKVFDFDFSDLEIKGRGAGGNILTKYPVRRIDLKSEGKSTLSGLDLWYDETIGRLNKEERGKYLGNFDRDDKILVIYNDGTYEVTSFELTNRYEHDKLLEIIKFNPELVISAVHYDAESKSYLVKRFKVETSSEGKRFSFINESKGSKLIIASIEEKPVVEVDILKGKARNKEKIEIDLSEQIDIKGWKATGNKLTQYRVQKVRIKQEQLEKKNPESQVPEASGSKKDESAPSNAKATKKKKTTKKIKTKKGKKSPKKSAKSSKKSGKKDNSRGKDGGYEIGTTIELDL